MVIQLPVETVRRHFFPYPKGRGMDGNAIVDYGALARGNNPIKIGYAKGFKGVAKLWSGHPTGIIFSKGARQLAASQFKYKQYVWLSTALEENMKMLKGSCIRALKCVEQE